MLVMVAIGYCAPVAVLWAISAAATVVFVLVSGFSAREYGGDGRLGRILPLYCFGVLILALLPMWFAHILSN